VVHIWKGNTLEEVFDSVRNVTDAGFETIISACWYLNYIKYGADWKEMRGTTIETNARYYYCDPHDFDGTEEQKALVLGGIAAMWGEFVDATNIVARIWPRASAIAERLWSDASQTTDADEAWPRLHELRCRLLRRGYRAEPTNYPDFCPFEWTDPLP